MKNAMERLNDLVKVRGPLVAGLDPDIEKVMALYGNPKDFQEKEVCMYEFCSDYIEAVKNVAAIKINIAFFEGSKMEDIFWASAHLAKEKGLFVIADVKRSDIGNTATQYAKAYLHKDSPIDAITIEPYFGFDGVKPYLDMAKKNGKGVFVLVKTSNPSSGDFQDLELRDGRKVYEAVADMVKEWGKYCSSGEDEQYYPVGAVVGATYPGQAKLLRQRIPKTFFLVPGYGAQGATAEDVAFNFDEENGGAAVNSSRGIMFAYKDDFWEEGFSEKDWYKASESAARKANQELKLAILEHNAS